MLASTWRHSATKKSGQEDDTPLVKSMGPSSMCQGKRHCLVQCQTENDNKEEECRPICDEGLIRARKGECIVFFGISFAVIHLLTE